MAASDARPVPRKNIAYRLYFAIRKNDGTLITSWTGQDSEVSLDGGTFTDCTNEAIEIGTSGCGYIDFIAAEMNADSVVYKLTVTNTSALALIVTLFPEEAGDYRVSDAQNVVLAAVTHTGAVIPTVSAVTGLTAADIAAIKAKTDNLPAIPASTTNITAGVMTTVTNLTNAPTVGDLTTAMKASVNGEVLNVLNVQTFAELSTIPAATSSLRDKLTWVFMWARNKSTQTSTQRRLFADDTTTVVGTETVSDDGTTYTKGEVT